MLSHVQRVTDYILCHEDYFRKVMEEQLRVESTEKLTVLKKQLARNEKRIADLKRLFMKIYEDNVNGKLSDDRFDMMSQSYDAEQKQLEEEVLSIQQEIEVQEQQIENIEKFVQKAHKYVHISASLVGFCTEKHPLHVLKPCKIRAETVHLLPDK